ncbi:tyrosine-type recombinase/integrase [Halobaculum sp. MBLA0143]|uniref:tyrosine-type recombinase/integrase n=1 Tax=Halobaculum sp. MBLA0143 TaxID=3079933 RepID=UPI003526BB8A
MSSTRAGEVEEPVAFFLRDVELHGKSERTRAEYERVLGRYRSFLADRSDRAPGEATHRDCTAFVHELRTDPELADSTVATYAAYLHRFYAYMTQVGAFDANPMALVMEELDERIDTDPARRELTVSEMRSFLTGVTHPLERALIVTLLKTGVRVGELCNLDLRDLSLSGVSGYDLGDRPALEGRRDSLFVPAAPSVGESYNGAERTASNKRKRDTVVPVDEELREALLVWLAIRPDTPSPAEPLFVGTASGWGRRLTPEQVQRVVRQHARRVGWYEKGAGVTENVTPHYFRHFFTTHLRERTGERGVVKYLRGDVADDIIDTYTHNWGGRVRETYERHVYELS